MSRHNGYLCAALLLLCAPLSTEARLRSGAVRKSVVKIFATIQTEDYTMPWQGGRTGSGTGTGFIIDKKRILSNAHVVSNARFIQVQKDGDPTRYNARVAFVGHDCDLAVLAVDDPNFFKNTAALDFADEIPGLNDEVFVLGFPMGGMRLSITKGIVSRIDYSVYTHSGVDQHLVMQVDAAINPGNSGGPIVMGNKVVGVAFQGMTWAENIGYGIPLPVIQHFLEDIKDGRYHGYPELGLQPLDGRNPALRSDLQMPEKMTGTVISYVDPLHSAYGIIKAADVITSIDGHEIANDGTIRLNGEVIEFSELVERKQCGDSVNCKLWRDGKEIDVDIHLKSPEDPFIYRNTYDRKPRYYIKGGLVFSPLSSEYLKAVRRSSSLPNSHQLLYAADFAKIDGLYKDRDEFVVMTRHLKHPANTYSGTFINGVVESVNGTRIARLADMETAFRKPESGFHIVKFMGMDDVLIIDAASSERADRVILQQYGIKESKRLEEE